MDKLNGILLEAVKQALLEPGEHRLFRSGKLAGLFGSRAGASGQAAQRAVQEGLLEVLRTEPRGKSQVDWVRATPRAVEFVHTQEAPAAALQQLRAALQATQDGIPRWLMEMRQRLEELAMQLASEVQRVGRRLEALGQRVDEAVQRLEAEHPRISVELVRAIPWAGEALGYLDRRRENGLTTPCPLSELFLAVREKYPDLTIAAYHNGLRRLFDRGLLRLLPDEGTNGLPEPEYALLDGSVTYFYIASRT
jgi:hypothetical protein